ncbi:hypothetical protein [Herbaspirillum lusitanum]|uniref:hypothetical protein n=1 Tax=Herbaspirillum lusitanum TaxID=213312 RepID=UPI0003763018|nr:hypothetical protein [Herbaspirillum lusitanum]
MVSLYLLTLSVGAIVAVAALFLNFLPETFEPIRVALACGLIGVIGGTLYCIRAVYVNKCVRQTWDPTWHVWYFLRPFASFLSGGASFLFLKAGLLVLESSSKQNSTELGFYALAFIAGLNVDKFVTKIEGVAHAVWGIEKSRSAGENKKT